jgi:uncharacterized damage-inducible protein DinB
MRADDLRLLWDYSYWATHKILDATQQLTAEQFDAQPALGDARSLRATLTHMLAAEQGWLQGFQGTPREAITTISADDVPDPAALATHWQAQEARMRDWLAGLDDAAAASDQPFGAPFWTVIAHVANHGTQHRSEAAMLLTDCGHSPGDIDLIFYLDERFAPDAAEAS